VALLVALAADFGVAAEPPPAPKPAVQTGGQPQPIATVQLKPGEVPKIEFDQPMFEFGRVPSGKDVLHDYWFTNTGTGPLEILAIKPSCGCTTMGEFDRVVQPGRKGRIPIKVATTHASGPIAKTITVQTNVPPPGNLSTLSIRGELWQAVMVSPASLYFGRIVLGQDTNSTHVRTAVITTSHDAVARITNLKSSNPCFKPEVTEVEPGKKYTLVVTAVPPFKIGNNFGDIELSTGVAELPTLKLQASLLVSPELEVMPDRLLVPSAASSSTKRPIMVRNNGLTLMQLSNAVCTHPDVNVELRETQAGRSWQIMVDVPAGYRQSRPGGDTITISTDRPGTGTITVMLVENVPSRPVTDSAAPMAGGGGTAPGAARAADVGRVP